MLDMDSLASRLRAERVAAGLTQKALADQAGVSKQAISSVEAGKTKGLKGDTLDRVTRALGVSPRWLLTGKGPKALGASQSVILDPVILTKTFNTIVGILREDGRYFDMERHAEAFAMVYAEGGELAQDVRDRLREMLTTGGKNGQEAPRGAGEEAGAERHRATWRG